MRLFFVSLILIINLKAFSRCRQTGCIHWRRRKLRALLSLPRSLSPTLNYAGIFQIKSRKKSKKEIKKEATPILGEASCGKLCMCTRFAVFWYVYLHFHNLPSCTTKYISDAQPMSISTFCHQYRRFTSSMSDLSVLCFVSTGFSSCVHLSEHPNIFP